jgi:DNA-binding XRE family transcriptional regulator
MIHQLAQPLGLSSETVKQIEHLVPDENELRARRVAILFGVVGKPF